MEYQIGAGIFVPADVAEPLARGLVLAVRSLRRAGEPTPPEVGALLRALLELIPQQEFRAKVSPSEPVFRGASVSVVEVAGRLEVSQQAVRGLARRGRLTARRGAGGHWEIDENSVMEREREAAKW